MTANPGDVSGTNISKMGLEILLSFPLNGDFCLMFLRFKRGGLQPLRTKSEAPFDP